MANERTVSISPNNNLDYLTDGYRRIFPEDNAINLEDLIFEEHIALCLTDYSVEITIRNCWFKKGLNVRRGGEQDKDYRFFAYKTEIDDSLSLPSHDNKNEIAIDTCKLNTLFLTGRSTKLDIYKSSIVIFSVEYFRCDEIIINSTKIHKFKLYDFSHGIVSFDTDKLVVSDYDRFVLSWNQTKREVSEIYHRFVLKSSKSIKSNNDINYQLSKSTSYRIMLIFGYFYSPLQVLFWMLVWITFFGLIYIPVFGKPFSDTLFTSGYTFLTIGFFESKCPRTFIETAFMLTEGVLGLVYTATLLVSITNLSKKQ